MKKNKICKECNCELVYCDDCIAYHHKDSFKEEHQEMKVNDDKNNKGICKRKS